MEGKSYNNFLKYQFLLFLIRQWIQLTSVGSIGPLQAAHRGARTLKPPRSFSKKVTETRQSSHCGCDLSHVQPVWQGWVSPFVWGVSVRAWPVLLSCENSLVVVADTVNVVSVHREGLALQAPSADHTAKAGRVVGLPTSLQDLETQSELFFTTHVLIYAHAVNGCILTMSMIKYPQLSHTSWDGWTPEYYIK